jgi:hypothetical protein
MSPCVGFRSNIEPFKTGRVIDRSRPGIARAACREILQNRVNADCRSACWLRRSAGSFAEIFVIAFT